MREDAAQAAPCQRRQQGVPGGGGAPPGALTPRGPPPLLPDGSAKGGHDDELTSLSWLQDTNLLRKLAGPPAASSASGNHQGNGTASGRASANAMSASASPSEEDDSREWGPPGQVPYNPQVHVTSKPPYSFSCLIFMAIEESAGKALPVKDIYAWILGHFPYFQRAPTGWKNSVRHNLSLNKCFRKVDKDKGQNIGKGSLWCIDPEFRPNLLQAMRKTPCFPYTQLNWAAPSPHSVPSSQDNGDQALSPDPSQAQNNVPSPMLFPFLSKRLAASSTKDQDVDAAATMLALQNGPSILPPPSDEEDEEEEEGYRESPPSPIVFTKKHLRLRQRATSEFIRTPPATNSTVITTSPSEDHTYSASLANGGGGDSSDGMGISITAVRSLAQSLSPPPEEDNPPEENSNGSSSGGGGGGVGGLGRLPLSSVPPRKRRAALAAAAALPRKSKRTSTSTTRRSSNGSAGGVAAASASSSSSDHAAQDMAEGAAHALLNLAKVATSQQQLLLQGNKTSSSPAIRERR